MKFKNIVTEMLTITSCERNDSTRINREERVYSIGDKRRIVVSISEYHDCAWSGEASAYIRAEMFDPHDYVYWNGEEEFDCHSDWREVFVETTGRVLSRELERKIEFVLAQAYGVLICTQY